MESASSWDELERITQAIEQRHSREGISDSDRRAYELVKTNHAKRVARTLVF